MTASESTDQMHTERRARTLDQESRPRSEPAFRASSTTSAYVPIGRARRHSPGDVRCARSVRGPRAQIGGSGCRPVSRLVRWVRRQIARAMGAPERRSSMSFSRGRTREVRTGTVVQLAPRHAHPASARGLNPVRRTVEPALGRSRLGSATRVDAAKAHYAGVLGWMFLLLWNTFSGSYLALTSASRR